MHTWSPKERVPVEAPVAAEDRERNDEVDDRGEEADRFDLSGPTARKDGEDDRDRDRQPEDDREDVVHSSTAVVILSRGDGEGSGRWASVPHARIPRRLRGSE